MFLMSPVSIHGSRKLSFWSACQMFSLVKGKSKGGAASILFLLVRA